jgi:hypothetical protein
MNKIKPHEFLELVTENKILIPRDHHFTGPPEMHEVEGSGGVWREEGRILANLAKILGGDVLEIGTHHAVSTRYIAEGLEESGKPGEVHTLDCNQRWVNSEDWPRIVAHQCYSFQFEPRPFAWAFIDGDHSFGGVIQDIIMAKKCGCNIIVFHDCSPHLLEHDPPSEASLAVPEALKEHDWFLTFVETGSGLVVAEEK